MSRFRASKPQPKEPVAAVEAQLASASCCQTLADVAKECYQESLHVETAAYTVKNWGGRHENEDRMFTQRSALDDLDYFTIGVLDGHDTDQASDLVSRLLPGALGRHFREGKSVELAYAAAMDDLEAALKKTVQTAGTCVCSCTLVGRFVWCANLGDCRAALLPLQALAAAADGAAAAAATKVTSLCWLSRDQKAGAPEEMRRIADAGGVVVDGRVEGLEPSRTLGDFDVKLNVPKGVISTVPEVRCAQLGERGAGGAPGRPRAAAPVAQALLVCATDGVWDVMSGQDVCDLVHARRELGKLQLAVQAPEAPGKVDNQPLRDLAEDLVQFAVARGSRDDCTVVTALLTIAPAPPGGGEAGGCGAGPSP